ncbi:hypothetical protein [Micromonospora saelicesensis]|uniref:hypothetical protein n=1 Tax=Micromonospora saelicesensis TaxID=285676 RepID=UPI0011BE9D2F|nr:hypothetical protein [Micromonospora saelicesensis]
MISANYQAPVGAEQPKVTDWLQAWGSVAAVFAGVAAAGAAGALLRQEQKRGNEAQQQRIDDRQEAALAEASAIVYTRLVFDHGPNGISGVQLDVQNFGQRAVIDLDVVVMLRDGSEIAIKRVQVLPPGGDKVKVEDRNLVGPHLPSTLADDTAKALLHYTDLENTRWKKVAKGRPFRLPRPSAATASGQD